MSDEDLDYLDDFLLDRIDENEDTEGKDEGILGLADLDGFLTAIVSGPSLIQPSQWLSAVWGDYEPVWESEKEFEKVLTLMIDIMNSTASTLVDSPQEYQALFYESNVDGNTVMIVDEWCEGYMRGVSLAQELWDSAGLEMQIFLTPIKGFTELTNWQAHELPTIDEVVKMQNAIIPNARAIHAYWLQRREDFNPSVATMRRETPRIGRNDPCPCGSGKKYKKCCLQ